MRIWKKQLLLTVGLFVALFGLLEVGGRIYIAWVTAQRERQAASQPAPGAQANWPLLHEYQRLSGDPLLVYELKPGVYSHGALVINSKGFRGREFTPLPAPGFVRILAIGDSCTFGTVATVSTGEPAYPERLETLLNTKGSGRYEVINAGVEGYDSRLAKRRLELALKYRPTVVLLYIGWNDIYATDPSASTQQRTSIAQSRLIYRSYALRILGRLAFEIRKGWNKLFGDTPREKALHAARNFYPAEYLGRLREMIQLARSQDASVVVLTLPNIFGPRTSQEDLRRAHYPWFSHDPEVVRALAENYNDRIRRVAEEEHVALADTAATIDAIPDKGKLFADAYHMYGPGHQILAERLAWTIRDKVLPPAAPSAAGKSPAVGLR